MSIHIQDVGASLDRVVTLLGSIPGAVPKASGAALKRAGETARTHAGRLAAAEYHISAGAFAGNSKQTVKSSDTGMTVKFAGRVLSLMTFHVRYSRGGLMFAKVKRSSGGGTLRHVFTANLGGGLGAFERVGKSRFPLSKKHGPSTAHMMQNENVSEEMGKIIGETYNKRIEHEITRILSGYGR